MFKEPVYNVSTMKIKLNIKKMNTKLLGLIAVILLALALYLASNLYFLMSDTYQAVFLDSGQVYFGKVQPCFGKFLTLRDVHYFDSNQQAFEESDLTLVKLEEEIHGPEDKMKILKDHILFIQNLTPESKVVEAISNKGA